MFCTIFTLLHSERPKLYTILAFLSAVGLNCFTWCVICILQVHPNNHRPLDMDLKFYEFAGKIVGKCLYESSLGGGYRQLVKARFTRSFLAQLIGLRVHFKVSYAYCY